MQNTDKDATDCCFQGKFVAAFASSNLGDVSPNTQGPKCQDTGEPCDLLTSSCNGKVRNTEAS